MISFDTNILVYALEGHPRFGEASRAIVRRADTDGGCVSILAKQEILSGAILHQGDVAVLSTVFDNFMGITIKPVDGKVVAQALELTKSFGRRCYGYDAIIIATALCNGAQEFWTNDEELLSLTIPNLKIKNPQTT